MWLLTIINVDLNYSELCRDTVFLLTPHKSLFQCIFQFLIIFSCLLKSVGETKHRKQTIIIWNITTKILSKRIFLSFFAFFNNRPALNVLCKLRLSKYCRLTAAVLDFVGGISTFTKVLSEIHFILRMLVQAAILMQFTSHFASSISDFNEYMLLCQLLCTTFSRPSLNTDSRFFPDVNSINLVHLQLSGGQLE